METALDETISLHGPLSVAVLDLSTISHALDQQMDGDKRLDEDVKSTDRTLNFSLYKKSILATRSVICLKAQKSVLA